MGCSQVKPAKSQSRNKSVTFKDPPVDFIEPNPKAAFVLPIQTIRTPENGLYPPKPPKTRRREIIPDDSMFSSLDEHALKVSEEQRHNLVCPKSTLLNLVDIISPINQSN